MSAVDFVGETVSVTDASARGVAGLVRAAEEGREVIVARHGRAVAAVIGLDRLESSQELELDLRSACLVFARATTDSGIRTSLDEAIADLGFNRSELEAELDADLAAGRP
jgi:prevent-host-death family protein